MSFSASINFIKMYYSTISMSVMCIIPVLCYVMFYKKRRRFTELAARIPGLPGLPLVGNVFQFRGNALDITNTLKKIMLSCMQYDGILKIWFGPILYIALINPNDVEIVLNKELNKDPIYRFLKPFIGESCSGRMYVDHIVSIWKVHRKLLGPSFHQKILDGFIEAFVEKSEILAKKLANTKGTFNAVDYLKPCTLDIICETVMGVNMNAQSNMDVPYIQAIIGWMTIINQRLYKWWLQPEWIYRLTPYAKQEKAFLKTLHDFTDNIIRIKKKEYFNRNSDAKVDNERYISRYEIFLERRSFLDLLIELSENGDRLTDKELKDEVDNMTVGGTDTTATTLSFALLLLGSHQSIQDKVFEELYKIFGDSERAVTKEDLLNMKYLEMVIKETLRLFSAAPFVLRNLKQEVKLENYTLPAGAGCAVVIYAIHRNPKIWGENADEFDPDNFLPEKCEKRHPYAYIPFSAGPRNCIAKQYSMMSMKVILSTLVRLYKIHSDADHKEIWRNGVLFEIFMRSVEGFPISIEPRIKYAI